MGAKDWISGYVFANADESDKLSIAMFDNSEIQRCFRLGTSPVPYFLKNAWSSSATYRKWFTDVFLLHIRKIMSKDVILLMDRWIIGDCMDPI